MDWKHSKTSEVSHLRRTTFYPPTGTGRDSYIMVNNGGTSQPTKLQGVATHGNFMKFGRIYSANRPTSSNKHQKYTSNGTGRDNYITSHWDSNNTESQRLRLFKTTFRDGETLRTSTTAWGCRKNPEEQQRLMRRLSTPKKRQEKYFVQIEDYKNRLTKRG